MLRTLHHIDGVISDNNNSVHVNTAMNEQSFALVVKSNVDLFKENATTQLALDVVNNIKISTTDQESAITAVTQLAITVLRKILNQNDYFIICTDLNARHCAIGAAQEQILGKVSCKLGARAKELRVNAAADFMIDVVVKNLMRETRPSESPGMDDIENIALQNISLQGIRQTTK
uniref:Uncharacterized protein n=1 Tax=Glossina pallidipes TaxID=7398 RepID=A0A1B0A6R3_GLOPL